MAQFTQTGVEYVAKNFKQFQSSQKQANKSIQDTGKQLKKTSKQSGSFSKSLTNLAGIGAKVAGAFVAVGATLKTAFDLGRQGAVVKQTAESFEFLLTKVNAAPGLLDALTVASGNTISQFEIMTSVATLLAGAQGEVASALANATPQLLSIAKAANKLNPSLGSTTFLFESLARGIKRSSPLILDNLGLTIKIGEANERFAASLGKSVGELTAQEKQLALLNEVLASGDTLIGQVGGTTDSATDSFDRLTAAIVNEKNEFLVLISEGIAPAADALFLLIKGQELVNEAVEDAAKDAVTTSKSYKEYTARIKEIAAASNKTVVTQKQLNTILEDTGASAQFAGKTVIQLSEETFDFRKNVLEASTATDGFLAALDNAPPILDGIASSTDFLSESLSGLGFSGDEVETALIDLGFTSDTLAGTQERLIEDANLLVEAWSAGAISAEQLNEGLVKAEDGSLKLDAAQRTELQASIAQAAALRDTVLASREAALAQSELAERLKDATSAQIAQAAISRLSELAKAASDEDFPKFLTAITETQEAFGLTDPESVALAESIGVITKALDDGVLPAENFDDALAEVIKDAADGVVDFEKLAEKFFVDMPKSIETTANAFDEGETSFSTSLKEMERNANAAVTDIVSAFKEPNFKKLGGDIAQGVAQGISASTPKIAQAARRAAKAALKAAQAELGVQSPSTVFKELGEQTMAGMAAGIAGAVGDVEASIAGATAATVAAASSVAAPNGGTTNIDRSFNVGGINTTTSPETPVTIVDDLAMAAALGIL